MFAIALVLLAVAVGLIWVAIASHKATHPGLVYSVRALAVLVAAIAILTWPFYVGRWIFNIECQHFAGYSVESPVDARSEGFFDERLFQQRELYGVSANNFWDDIDVLGNGAVAFFEVHRRTTAWHHGEYGVAADHVRYFLADEGAKECVPQSKEFGLRAKMMALAPGKCLAAERAEPLRSRFVITASGYHHTDSSATTKITDKRSGKTVGTFKSYNHFNPLNFVSGRDAVCPQYADRSFSPHRTLASMVFMDRNGKTKHLEELREVDDENIKRLVRGPDFSQLELHSVRVKEGIPPGTNRDFQVTEVVVTLQRPVMLLLESEANVHWRVMVAPGADVPAVVIAGSVLRVQASGVRYTKVYQVATSDRPEISAKLSGRRASEQSFGRRALVTVDGQSRSDLHE